MRCRNHIPYGNGVVRVGIHVEELWISAVDELQRPCGLQVLQCKDELRRPLIFVAALAMAIGIVAASMVHFSSSNGSTLLPLILFLACATASVVFYFMSYLQFGVAIDDGGISYYCSGKWRRVGQDSGLDCVVRQVKFLGKHKKLFGSSAYGVFVSLSGQGMPQRELLIALTSQKHEAEFVQELIISSFPWIKIKKQLAVGFQTIVPCSCKMCRLGSWVENNSYDGSSGYSGVE